MVKFRLVNKASGIGKDSGKPWCKIELASDKADGKRVTSEFWCNPVVKTKLDSIAMDSYVYAMAELDENLRFCISDIRLVDVSKA